MRSACVDLICAVSCSPGKHMPEYSSAAGVELGGEEPGHAWRFAVLWLSLRGLTVHWPQAWDGVHACAAAEVSSLGQEGQAVSGWRTQHGRCLPADSWQTRQCWRQGAPHIRPREEFGTIVKTGHVQRPGGRSELDPPASRLASRLRSHQALEALARVCISCVNNGRRWVVCPGKNEEGPMGACGGSWLALGGGQASNPHHG